jgi:hypothetical protein
LLIDSALEQGEKLPRPAKYRDRVAV